MSDVGYWIQTLFRWMHIVAGILWIGHLWFFNWVNANFAKTMDGATKKTVVPELMPRALWMFRWGAAWTFLSGVLLLLYIYYHGGVVLEDPNGSMGMAYGMLALVLITPMVYDVVQKAMKGTVVANVICLAVLAAIYVVLRKVGGFSSRALFIHMGGLLGTTMAMNVWMRIWPAQRKIIAATKEGNPPDADLVAQAGLRSRHNTYLSVPLVFFMTAQHVVTGGPATTKPGREILVAAVFLIGFGFVRFMYGKSAKPEVAAF